ncbi:MAG: hypothetical protein ACKVQW_14775 [Pyrinomonadaceae bacterium]
MAIGTTEKRAVHIDPLLEREKVRLARMRARIASLRPSATKEVLENELAIAKTSLNEGNVEYAKQFRKEFRSAIFRLKLTQAFGSIDTNPNIRIVIMGVICYSAMMAVGGLCAVVVYVYQQHPDSSLISFLRQIWILYIFAAVSDLGISPKHYLLGLLGGVGAIASIVRRFDEIERSKKSFWSLFAQGLLNPIVASFVATVIVSFVNAGLLNILKQIPAPVIAFFAGFSEQLIDRVGTIITPKDKVDSPDDK